MDLTLAAMAGLVPKLSDLLMSEYVVHNGLKPDMESLSNELAMLNAALLDASQVPPAQLSEADKLWASQVRELTYDTEDAIDVFIFILRVAPGECASTATTDGNVFKKILGKIPAAVKKVKHRRRLSDRLKDIKKLTNEMTELRAKYTVRCPLGVDLAVSTGLDRP